MRRVLIPALTAGAVLALAAGSYSALAGAGPVNDVVAVVAHSDGPDDAESVAVEEEGAGADKVAQAIADEFDVTQGEVLALHEDGIGFGALFKLYAIARARGISVNDLLAEIDASGGGFAFGKMEKALTDDEQAALVSGPKNLGKLVSAASKGDGEAGDDEVNEAGLTESSRGDGHAPPDAASALGKGKRP